MVERSVENGDFDRGKDAKCWTFLVCICCYDIRPLVSKRILERGAKIRDLQQINNFESFT